MSQVRIQGSSYMRDSSMAGEDRETLSPRDPSSSFSAYTRFDLIFSENNPGRNDAPCCPLMYCR